MPDGRAGDGRCCCACSRSASAAPTARSPKGCSAWRPTATASSCSATSCSRVVERDGHGFTRGDLVTATVRRSCGHCLACAEGSPDSCLTGDYSERGITGLDGFARELVAEDAGAADPDPGRRSAGSACSPSRRRSAQRAIRHARDDRRPPAVAARARARGRRRRDRHALDLPAAARGRRGLDGVARAGERRSSSACGARYVSTTGRPARRPRASVGGFDLVDRGGRRRAADGRQPRPAAPQRRRLPARHRRPRSRRSRSTGRCSGSTRSSRTASLFGSVNAHRAGLARRPSTALDRARERWPTRSRQFVGLRVPLDRFAEAFAYRGGKATLVLDGRARASGRRAVSRCAGLAGAHDRVADLGRAVAVLERRAVRRDVACRRRSPRSMWCSSCTNVSPQPMMWPGGHQCSQNGWSVSETSTVLKPRARSPSARNTCSSFRRSMSNASEPFEPLISHWNALRRPSARRVASIVPTEPFSNSTAASIASSTLRPGDERLHEAGDRRDLAVQEAREVDHVRRRGRRARRSRPRRARSATCRATGRRPSPAGSGRGSGGSRPARPPRSSRARGARPARSGS